MQNGTRHSVNVNMLIRYKIIMWVTQFLNIFLLICLNIDIQISKIWIKYVSPVYI